ncbi:hypothetical protein M426DRAFT_321682 [Hypoxylon sp. CI-4A]|nr:hypothetical protein M426DRAFT_321682 [Hypoxylon sp. CI-4A]
MPSTIAITGASGKLGGATLDALLAHNLAPASSIVALTSSQPGSSTWTALQAKAADLQVRHASFDDAASFEQALRGVDKLFLVSTPHIEMDYDDEEEVVSTSSGEIKYYHYTRKPDGRGREAHHKIAIDAAARAGVRHLYYSSLAYAFSQGPGAHSRAAVMRAHLLTEAYLRSLHDDEGKFQDGVTVIREGLYSESWPLYLGYFSLDGSDDGRVEVPLAGDGRISWTAIEDLGVGSAVVLTRPSAEFAGRVFYLANGPESARSLSEVAELVGRARGREVKVEIVGTERHIEYYIKERGRDRRHARWWSTTYDALEAGEALIDDGTLEGLLKEVGVKPKRMEDIVEQMVKGEIPGRGF